MKSWGIGNVGDCRTSCRSLLSKFNCCSRSRASEHLPSALVASSEDLKLFNTVSFQVLLADLSGYYWHWNLVLQLVTIYFWVSELQELPESNNITTELLT